MEMNPAETGMLLLQFCDKRIAKRIERRMVAEEKIGDTPRNQSSQKPVQFCCQLFCFFYFPMSDKTAGHISSEKMIFNGSCMVALENGQLLYILSRKRKSRLL